MQDAPPSDVATSDLYDEPVADSEGRVLMESIPPRSLDQFPPPSIVQSLIDTFFARAHNQPYSFFHPASFRQSIDDDTVPRCLLFAVLAIAVRYSTHPAFVGRTYEASKAYSKRSWLYALEDHLATDDNSDLTFVQAVAILAIIDFTGETSHHPQKQDKCNLEAPRTCDQTC